MPLSPVATILANAKQHEKADTLVNEAVEKLQLAASVYFLAGKITHSERAQREAARIRRLQQRLKQAV